MLKEKRSINHDANRMMFNSVNTKTKQVIVAKNKQFIYSFDRSNTLKSEQKHDTQYFAVSLSLLLLLLY